ncbi:MAG: anthranilate phosphoribosyltransferase [Deltaproteobacteria bacterium CG_4_8_14_3_um_filter_51_11]|nr:anthranilate phosphoribosyltransferase [bacterium]OIP43700.1 MAG: anthranilate phosphoribosyltransferase [Desulfobacteraceae bacterium CG2_30_51_40]PIP48138.1 MAG: anthranilate phosphoribosyltransferase [Deltaproteobacteria bacterium CG23_combo_of_CG06-09_8_20_14_all_51_20]PIV99332.1 MAG: anthranilate phosphoribosyltransferase [Deltaproteobacteria bacterium CG17_big_fil_post_rev_8_21_14_2_50_51_6]PIX19448.1 MAG: anthranilate phosphoribosyltransferase [Deltaproteobacteria bacterium CG_4_8_14_
MFSQILSKIINGKDLAREEIGWVFSAIFSGTLTDARIGAFMAALATKGETFEELAGAAEAMRRKAVRIQAASPVVVDTCGTGGDGAHTFNISTTAAFVVAGSGLTVAKHGNRSVSSRCGSADVLEALGVNLNTAQEVAEEAVNEIGIGFLFAPLFHGAMKYALGPRKELGVRTIFNMLGPLTNPAAANCQVLGVFSPRLTEMFADALNLLGCRRAFVVHGHDGLDEISVCAPTRVSELRDKRVHTYDISPEQFFEDRARPEELAGGTPDENAVIIRRILSGKENGAKRNIVSINAGAALVAGGKAEDLSAGVTLADDIIESGKAMEKLDALIEFTRQS